MEPRARVELATCRLRIGCSTTELPRLGGENYLTIRGKLLSILQNTAFLLRPCRKIPFPAPLIVKTGTWPSRSRCRTAETAAATTQYTSRGRADRAGSGSRTQPRSGARTTASLEGDSNEIS